MWRDVVAVIAGIVTISVVVFGVESVGMTLFDVPEDLDLSDVAQLATFMDRIPLGALVTIVVAWVLGGFLGGMVAGYTAGEQPVRPAAIVGLFDVGAVALTLATFPHPVWMKATGLLLPLPAALLGGVLARRLPAYVPPSEPPPG